jgi:hypothetical protein
MTPQAELKIRITQVPGEPAQYNGWTGPELLGLVGRLETENKRLKRLLTRAADALDNGDLAILGEMRKAAE